MTPLRLQKWLSTVGVASRREAERMILAGRVHVNGVAVTQLGTKVDPDVDVIHLDGSPVAAGAPKKVYFVLCKPDGVMTTRSDPEGRRTVFDLPAVRALGKGLFPVGRLDFHTEGLLILSNDGEMVHRLMHPKWKLPRHYYVFADHRLSPTQEAHIKKGMELEDGPTQPVDLEYLDKKKGQGAWYRICVREGRNRLVRRMFEACDCGVRRLIRFGFGELRLSDDLAPGEIRSLHREELIQLRKATDLPESDPPT